MMLAWPMIAFGWVTNLLQRGTASWKRMLEVLGTEPGASTDAGASSHIASREQDLAATFEFRNLTSTTAIASVLRLYLCHAPRRNNDCRCRRNRIRANRRSLNLLPRLQRSAARHGLRRWHGRPRTFRWRSCAAQSASCRRSHFCSARRSRRTSRSASPAPGARAG